MNYYLLVYNLLFFCCMLCLLAVGTDAQPINRCTTNSTYDPGNTYRANLNEFLRSTVDASRTDDFNISITGSDPDRVFGIFMCRGDVSSGVCSDCLSTASTRVLNGCPNQKSAYVWMDDCFLRYSDQSFFSIFSRFDGNMGYCFSDIYAEPLEDLVNNVMNKVADEAANDTRPDKKFAVKEVNYSSNSDVYTLAQCTPDLSSIDCRRCLSNAIQALPTCCNNRQGCRIAFPSCIIRYEMYQFYNNGSPSSSRGKRRISVQVIIGITVPTILFLVLFVITFVFLKTRSRAKMQEAIDGARSLNIDPESLKYSLSEIQIATNNFSAANKIGQGGFGPVYKGTLPNGEDIAVKRLSRRSGQGAEEFKNEIVVVAKLRHNNLVRLLGFCLEGEEKSLVYEFVPNKSLDYFLFDPEKQRLLDWSRRYKIIGGIARGLLYLHEDSPLRIVHRDLKAGNILLDEGMNAKIADFGMAKICGVDQSKGNTDRIAGTFGYMAPEYARSGQFSIKSDVFSFGVVILEIITGKKNSSFCKSEDSQDLLSYARQQWRNGTPLALLDPTIADSYVETEVLRCIHVGLLCVEEYAERRPRMASVVYMLNGSSTSLPSPYLPTVSRHNKSKSILEEIKSEQSDTKFPLASVIETSITKLYPR
ncbi:hypothetical protein ACH5RR_014890 [Cinchona calisaya]|uniref:Uncharacterized protein n=1 Tax=Cinchona calisaya TaxID=153742 RepID=A0ABD2ZT90_9GENT